MWAFLLLFATSLSCNFIFSLPANWSWILQRLYRIWNWHPLISGFVKTKRIFLDFHWVILMALGIDLHVFFFSPLHAQLFQSRLPLCNPMGYSLPGSPVHEIILVIILECFAISSFKGSSWWPRDQTYVSWSSCVGRQILHHWAPREPTIFPIVILFFLIDLVFMNSNIWYQLGNIWD